MEARDGTTGLAAFSARCEALQRCRKIVIVVSKSYLKSVCCLGEADLAGNIYSQSLARLHALTQSVVSECNRV